METTKTSEDYCAEALAADMDQWIVFIPAALQKSRLRFLSQGSDDHMDPSAEDLPEGVDEGPDEAEIQDVNPRSESERLEKWLRDHRPSQIFRYAKICGRYSQDIQNGQRIIQTFFTYKCSGNISLDVENIQ